MSQIDVNINDGIYTAYYYNIDYQDNNDKWHNKSITDSNNNKYIGNIFLKNISCNRGIKEIKFEPSVSNNYAVNTTSFDCIPNNNNIPVNSVNTIILNKNYDDDYDIKNYHFDIDCENHPIAYITLNRIGGNTYVNYACSSAETGDNSTSSYVDIKSFSRSDLKDNTVNTDLNLKYFNSNYEFNCSDNSSAITSIKFNFDNDEKSIDYKCKNVTSNYTSNYITSSTEFSKIISTDKSISGFNISVDNILHPTQFYGGPIEHGDKYNTTSQLKTSTKDYDEIGFEVNCPGSAITHIEMNEKRIKYKCDKPLDMNSNTTQFGEYTFFDANYNHGTNNAGLNYVRYGAWFDKIKCDNGKLLSGFSSTYTKDGPKLKWVCGKIK